MPLLKSLVCFQGMDNGRRFLLINLGCYCCFLIASSLLVQSAVLFILFLAVFSFILATSAIRRMHDAGFSTLLALFPVVIFWLTVLGIVYIQHGAKYLLLLLSILVTLAAATISHARVRRSRAYILGYSGPVNLSDDVVEQSNKNYAERIEPTIATNQKNADASLKETIGFQEELVNFNTTTSSHVEIEQRIVASNNTEDNWENYLRQWCLENRQLSISIIFAITLLTIVGVIWSLSNEKKLNVEQEAVTEQLPVQKERLDKLKMPDDYWLMLDQNNALTIAWQGEFQQDGEIWSQLTGKGDSDCTNVRFENGDTVRSLLVSIQNEGDYYADFSPLDTKKLIDSIAKRSRFNLCGIEFSLKGTQAKLMSNRKYSVYLEEE